MQMDVSHQTRLWSVLEQEMDYWKGTCSTTSRPFEEVYRCMRWLVDDGYGEWVEEKIYEKIKRSYAESLLNISNDIKNVVTLWDNMKHFTSKVREVYGAHISTIRTDILPLSAAALIDCLLEKEVIDNHITEIINYLLENNNQHNDLYQRYLHVVHLTYSQYQNIFHQVGLLLKTKIEHSMQQQKYHSAEEALSDVLAKLQRVSIQGWIPHTLRQDCKRGLEGVFRTQHFLEILMKWPSSLKDSKNTKTTTILTLCQVLLTSDMLRSSKSEKDFEHVSEILQAMRKVFIEVVNLNSNSREIIELLCQLYDLLLSTTTVETASKLLKETISKSSLGNTLDIEQLVLSIDFVMKTESTISFEGLQYTFSLLLSLSNVGSQLFVESLTHRMTNRLLHHKNISFQKESILLDSLQNANLTNSETRRNLLTMLSDIRDQVLKVNKGRVYILNSMSWPRLPTGSASHLTKPQLLRSLEQEAELQYSSCHRGKTLSWVETASKLTLLDTERKLLISCSYVHAVILMLVWPTDGSVSRTESEIINITTSGNGDNQLVGDKQHEIQKCLQQLQSNGVLTCSEGGWRVDSSRHSKKRVNCLSKTASCSLPVSRSSSPTPSTAAFIEATLTRMMKSHRRMSCQSLVAAAAEAIGGGIRLDVIKRRVTVLTQKGYFEMTENNKTILYVT